MSTAQLQGSDTPPHVLKCVQVVSKVICNIIGAVLALDS